MKFLLISTLILTFFTTTNSQLIDITVCSDNSCKNNCISWTATNNQCSTCRNSQCSVSNPSSMVQNMNSITFYTDTSCSNQNIISGTSSIPITLDNTCHLLHDNNFNIIGSYNASNKSALIGGIIGAVTLLILIIICISCICCCKRRQIEPPQVNAIVVDENQLQSTYPRPLSGYGYAYNPQQTHAESQPYPNWSQQTKQPIYETYIIAPVPMPPPPPPQVYQTYPSAIYTQNENPQQSTYYPPPVPSAPPAPSAPYYNSNEYPQKYT
jgi:hypothetical protein